MLLTRSLFLLIVLFSGAVLAGNLDIIKQADQVRVSDHNQAKAMLANLDVATLSPYEKNYADYVTGIVTSLDGDFESAIEIYTGLLSSVKNAQLRLRVMQSMLILLAGTNQWERALVLSEQLLAQIEKTSESSESADAYVGLASFYNRLKQPDMVLRFSEKVLQSEISSDFARCVAMAFKAAALTDKGETDFISEHYDTGIAFCSEQNLTINVIAINYHRIRYLVMNERYTEARTVALNVIDEVEKQQYPALTTSYYATLAEVSYELGDSATAKVYSEKVLKTDPNVNFPNSTIRAYKVLSLLAVDEGDFANGYKYLTMQLNKEKNEFESQLAKELAIQQAWFELDAKENEIVLLDKQNALLKTKAQLTNERLENSLLALTLASLVLAVMLYWSYRSRKMQNKLRTLAQNDALTGIYNRGFFTECMAKILAQNSRNQQPVTLLLLDLDHFKSINDTYGHQIGDWALRAVVRAIEECLTDDCVFGRMGGEEFGIIIQNHPSAKGYSIAECCRLAIENIDTKACGHEFNLTASFGVCDTEHAGYQLDNLFSAADLALYQSKRFGRNRVYESDTTTAM